VSALKALFRYSRRKIERHDEKPVFFFWWGGTYVTGTAATSGLLKTCVRVFYRSAHSTTKFRVLPLYQAAHYWRPLVPWSPVNTRKHKETFSTVT
jgi:hypothetical protein